MRSTGNGYCWRQYLSHEKAFGNSYADIFVLRWLWDFTASKFNSEVGRSPDIQVVCLDYIYNMYVLYNCMVMVTVTVVIMVMVTVTVTVLVMVMVLAMVMVMVMVM